MYGFREYAFQFTGPPDEAASQLIAAIYRHESGAFAATITSEHVNVCRHSTGRNSFNPIFVGRFERTPNGTTLTGHFRVHWLAIAFLCVFYGFLVFQLVHTLAQPEAVPGYVPGWRDRELRSNLEFLLWGMAVPVVAWVVNIPNRNAILRAIAASTSLDVGAARVSGTPAS
jgi:hypothetical protein